MTQKQVIFGKSKKSRKGKQNEDEYECENTCGRPVLLSSDDVDRMAVESTRARLISHLVSKTKHHSSREFASCYHAPTRYIEPPYSSTSHTYEVPITKIPQVIPAYPSLIQPPRWCPYTEPPSARNSDQEITMDQNFTCRCIDCTSPRCPAKLTSNIVNPRNKNNIMTFCDRSTMTWKVADAGCGRTPLSSTPEYSDKFMSYNSTMTAVKDDQGKFKMEEMFSRKDYPAPILKKGPCPPFNECCNKKLISDDFQDVAVRDIDPATAKPAKCVFKKEEDFEAMVSTRKNIYNEGISDTATTKFPLSSLRIDPPECSGSSVPSKYYDSDDDYIPHAHGSESKYHSDCAKPAMGREYRCTEDSSELMRHCPVAPSPRCIKTYSTKHCRRCKPMRIIRLPKKVLTSERVSDSCGEKRPKKKGSSCKKKLN